MNKFLKNTAIVALTCTITGSLLIMGSLAYLLPKGVSRLKEQLRQINEYENVVQEKKEIAGFKKIKIGVNVVDVDIVKSDYFAIEYSVAQGTENVYRIEDDELIIDYEQDNGVMFGFGPDNDGDIKFSLGNFLRDNEYIRIYVPADMENIEIISDVGNVKIAGVNSEKLYCESDTGNVRVENMVSDEFKVDCDTGNIELYSMDTNRLEVNSDVGNIIVYMVGKKEEYNGYYSCDVGRLVVDGADHSGIDKDLSQIEEGATKSITAESDTGNISISFAK